MEFEVIKKCSTTRARVSRMRMPHGETMTPTFMPVATQATMKGVTPSQIESVTPPITLILNNTYHLSQNPGTEVLDACEGASHGYQGWRGNLLTDSGGFQMVSLVKLSKITEEGVLFANPYDPTLSSLLTPEKSMQVQHSIGADIMMQLDDVVARLDRCIVEHDRSGRTDRQNLFAIVQGGLDHDLRDKCLEAMLDPARESKLPGYAIGGLSGGEEKSVFWRIIAQCAKRLPENKPRYSMGIGYGEDLLVCAALGVDMADCVFPTRTARFGVALTFTGPLNLRQNSMASDFNVIDSTCPCATCLEGNGLSRASLWNMVGKETAAASAVTIHNLTYQLVERMTLGQTLGGGSSIPDLTPIRRPGYGTKGRPFEALVNAFEVRPPDITVYNYDVKIGPENERRPARLNRAIWRHLVESANPFNSVAVAYDGQALAFSPDGKVSRSNHFTVTLTFARPIHLGALKRFVSGESNMNVSDVAGCIQALNIAIQHAPMLANPARGASFFIPPDRNDPRSSALSQGLEMWRGYYSSLRPGIAKVFVNLDVSSQVMFKPGNLANLLIEIGRSRDPRFNENNLDIAHIDPRFAISAQRLLKNLKITLRVGDRTRDGFKPTRKIRQLVNSSALTSEFEIEEGQTTNVFDFFKKNYGVTLSHPNWPCVRVSKTALYPIELCQIDEGQKYGKPLSGQLTTELLRLTTIRPRERLEHLRKGIATINPSNNTAFDQWETAVSPSFVQVTARLLPAPDVTYQRPITPHEGAWNMARETKLWVPSTISHSLVFVFESENAFPRGASQQCVSGFFQSLTTLGLTVKNARPAIVYVPRDVSPGELGRFFRETVQKLGGPPPELLLCFLPSKPNPFYGPIKMFGDIVVGCATQCVFIPKAAKGNAQYWANLALKVNAKLGGRNCHAPLGVVVNRPTIVFGADVYHAAPRSFAPSIAGLVSSTNPSVTEFTSSISVQGSREELMLELERMVGEHLVRFEQANKIKPERLIFLRDGISEGEFAKALSFEVEAIRKACKALGPEWTPRITYITVGKQHHVSLFPKNPQDGDRNNNVKAGTLVDQVITSPFTFDWYLQSQASLLGTGRCAHYTVLADESAFSPDDLQQFVYGLCYTYARCTRSVSVPAPAYYADLLATRAALLLGASDQDDLSSLASGEREASAQRMLGEYRARLPKIHPTQVGRQFYL
ncbi:hypothetical protein JCM16303_003610 [Sporobolomyces ruberrimus]